MGLFGGGSKVEKAAKAAEEEKKREIKRIVEMTQIKMPTEEQKGFTPLPREYTSFLQEIKKQPRTKYEKACFYSQKILGVNLSESSGAKLNESLKAAYLNATPKGVMSFTLLSMLILVTASVIFMVFGGGTTFGAFALMFSLGTVFYIYNYPNQAAKSMSMKMSADSVLAILYMVIYMRTSPNLEGALRFASENLGGPLSWDLKKLMWDIQVGKYLTADQAVISYIEKWKEKNKEFAEALHLLRGIAVEPTKREVIFRETISVILNGTKERTKHYATGLRMPMMLVHAMGVLLPVMGLVLFPVIIIFMADTVKPVFVFFGYDVLLPLVLYFFMDYILQTKPPTFSQPDISRAKGIPPMGKMKVGKYMLPIWPFAVLVGVPLFLIGYNGMQDRVVYNAVNSSVLIIVAIAGSIIVYTYLDSFQKMKVRKDIEKVEDEFSVALFQLGNQISGGIPIELAIDKAIVDLKDLKISEMFRIIALNMKKFGCTFEDAFFDKEMGAINYYPSKLIESIMRTIVESSRKSITVAAESMITVSSYLKNVHNVKEEIEEILGETISSMRFLGMFLAPMVSGVTITMAVIILQVLSSLGTTLQPLLAEGGGNAAQSLFLMPWGVGAEPPITPQSFQLIVGLYMVEIAVILSFFLNKIVYGEDLVGERSTMASTLIFALVIYYVSWIGIYSMFGASIESLLSFGGKPPT